MFDGNAESLERALATHLSLEHLSDNQLTFILEYLSAHATENSAVERKKSDAAVTGLDWRVEKVFIDVPNALLVSAAATMDAMWSRGAAMALLAASGRDLRVWASLNPKNGCFCNFVTIEEKVDAQAITADEITARTKGSPCLHGSLGCDFDFEGACRVTSDVVVKNLEYLAKRKAIELNDTGDAVKVR